MANDVKLPEETRMEIFRALVEAQDQDQDVPRTRKMVADRFGVSNQKVRAIEREGLEAQWPPL